ncbi:MAG TPA: hypothetical protein VGM03_10755, partial [Phycisphaerae bacterium]
MRRSAFVLLVVGGLGGQVCLVAGCGSGGTIAAGGRTVLRAADRVIRAVNRVQDEDPRTIALPADAVQRNDTVVIEQQTTVITDVHQQLVVEDLPDITLLGIENQTGCDIFVEFFVNGVRQSGFVLDGETVLLEYPCLDTIELDTEDDFDPFTGDFVASFDLTAAVFTNPEDFICGDAFI